MLFAIAAMPLRFATLARHDGCAIRHAAASAADYYFHAAMPPPLSAAAACLRRSITI